MDCTSGAISRAEARRYIRLRRFRAPSDVSSSNVGAALMPPGGFTDVRIPPILFRTRQHWIARWGRHSCLPSRRRRDRSRSALRVFFNVALAFKPTNPAIGGMDRTSGAISRAEARRYIASPPKAINFSLQRPQRPTVHRDCAAGHERRLLRAEERAHRAQLCGIGRAAERHLLGEPLDDAAPGAAR